MKRVVENSGSPAKMALAIRPLAAQLRLQPHPDNDIFFTSITDYDKGQKRVPEKGRGYRAGA